MTKSKIQYVVSLSIEPEPELTDSMLFTKFNQPIRAQQIS